MSVDEEQAIRRAIEEATGAAPMLELSGDGTVLAVTYYYRDKHGDVQSRRIAVEDGPEGFLLALRKAARYAHLDHVHTEKVA